MWKKFPRHNRASGRSISGPTLIQTTFDEEMLDSIPYVSELQATPTSIPSAGYRRAESPLKDLSPPPSGFPDPALVVRPVSAVPTASSVYSKPTPDLRQHDQHFSPVPTMLPVPYEVSPPSSVGDPEEDIYHGSPDSRSVSPVETLTYYGEHAVYPPEPNQTSERVIAPTEAPALHDDGSSNRLLTGVSDRASIATRWDDFMRASLVTDERRPSVPGHNGLGAGPATTTDMYKHQQRMAGGGMDGLAESVHRQDSSISGRSQVGNTSVDHTPPPTRPMMPPRKSSKRLDAIKAGVANNRLLLRFKSIHQGSHAPSPDADIEEDEIKPTLPLKAGRNSPRTISSPTTLMSQVSSRLQFKTSPVAPSGASVTSQRSSDAASMVPAPSQSPTYANTMSRPATGDTDFEPPLISRFSDTTYATGATFDTPPVTPSIGTGNGSVMSTPCMREASFVNSRPGPYVLTDNTKATTRKPLSAQYSPITPASSTRSPTITKSLPPSPPEAEPADRITHLQAQLDGLQRRRHNLQRIIGDLSRLLLPGPHTCDPSTREGMKRTVDECQAELDEVLREQHEVGLTLHRAWRRREREECADEPTGLWVRRVTT